MLRNAFEPWHLILIIAALVLLFGSKKLPDMARGLGRSMRILKSETKALKEERQTDEPHTPAATTPRPESATGH
ncbi:Sec-independent protein translocase subunit TatA [Streptomyces pinistramenti]|uniref:Sec-independent protein translocase subunit TatA n=1 Tax=Streptomyces pinistramenti TaxID=2884812 RepID=UPI001D06F551|nr:Sec-independent protein translocase subunit TatA [Streptomyces pinistramenti]MCB5911206.1 Sec-independent protein translocase subunit TatA [Streptomyces pinistramenti]